jgi:molecular chaperone GrpE
MIESRGHGQDQKVGNVKDKKTVSAEKPIEARSEKKAEDSKGMRRRGRGLKGRVADLEEELARALAEAEENYDRLLRARADFENLKKRTAREMELTHQRAGEGLVGKLLPVLDDLEKAVEAAGGSPELEPMKDGLSLIHKGLVDALREGGVSDIDPVGEVFDPNLHEAVLQKSVEGAEPGVVLEVLQKGYLMNGHVLRAAKVVVASAEEE